MFKLNEILRAKEAEISAAKKAKSIGDLKRMILDAPEVRSFKNALSGDFGVIAEVKKCSPSIGEMRAENFEAAPQVYGRSRIVKAISVITDSASFGMGHEWLMKVRNIAKQPILKKDFVQTEYGVFQARAYGADAILLMASVLDTKEKGQRLFDLASELNLDVLYEAHTQEEIDRIPNGVQIFGINSRNFMGQWRRADFAKTKFTKSLLSKLPFANRVRDFSTDLNVFSLIKNLPKEGIKVAESGISPSTISGVMDLGFSAALIGTSLLKDQDGVEASLAKFERVIQPNQRSSAQFRIPVHA